MLGDHDHWPVTCCECGFVHYAEIGSLKATERFHCPRCRSDLVYFSAAFRNQLHIARATLEHTTRKAFEPGWNHLAQRQIPPDEGHAHCAGCNLPTGDQAIRAH